MSMMNDIPLTGDSVRTPPSALERTYRKVREMHQRWLDNLTPYASIRWGIFLSLVALYGIRVFFLQGWYIITYALGIYILNLFIAFLTPKIDPSSTPDSEDDGPALPTRASEEFRPFIRRLPEFKFWYSASRAVVVAMVCTFFDALNIPVFWPILVMYFLLLFAITMKRQIKHMIKYRYIPFTHGKTQYKGKDDMKDAK